jgi:hypothetical protein
MMKQKCALWVALAVLASGSSPYILVVNPKVPATSVAQLGSTPQHLGDAIKAGIECRES